MSHHHHHHHGHAHRSQANQRRLGATLLLAACYMVAEAVGGWLTNSLALLADAGHMLSDVAALGLSYFAVWISGRPSPAHRTYGYYRAEILAALANGATLVALSLFIVFEAFQRILSPPEVQGDVMMWIAVGGLLVNLAGLWILHAGREESLNVRGAFLHVLSDALGSVAVIAAGLLIWAFQWQLADPIASAVLALLIIYSSWRLLAESVSVLMENAPAGVNVDEVHSAMAQTHGILEVHDLHVWTITSGLVALSAHVVVEDRRSYSSALKDLREMLHKRFGIDHITIQVEPEDFGECEAIV